jgi:hypothetical protein
VTNSIGSRPACQRASSQPTAFEQPFRRLRGKAVVEHVELAACKRTSLTSKSALYPPHGILGRPRIGTGWSAALQQAAWVGIIAI